MADMIYVYRLEDDAQDGVYNTGKKLNISYSPDSHRPQPWDDGIAEQNVNYYCGFGSLNALAAWFDDPSEYDSINEAGVLVSVYVVPTLYVMFGYRQLMFKLDEAQLVNSMTIWDAVAGRKVA